MRLGAPLLPPTAHAGPVPLPPEAARVVRDALDGRPHGAAVVVFTPDGVEVQDREELVQHYRRTGVRELVTRLRRAVVPPGHCLALVDLEVGTRVIAVEVEALCRLADLDGPSVETWRAP